MVHFHDLHVPVRTEPAGDLFDETEQEINPEAHIGCPDDRNLPRRPPYRLGLVGREAGSANDHRLSQPGGEGGMGGSRCRSGEINHDVTIADYLLGVVADCNAEPADPGELTDVLIDVAAARPGA